MLIFTDYRLILGKSYPWLFLQSTFPHSTKAIKLDALAFIYDSNLPPNEKQTKLCLLHTPSLWVNIFHNVLKLKLISTEITVTLKI